ncbi:isopenicillin N synthase family oxygenase [Pseudooceanicola sediminis]|uniref:2-oxoglutarate-dependent ethylene/succinate-forming enzyme n=1 Tax=Pseudooceanicola sediminis TaxID=2211117 RepID=A0A399J259_9RHOB|nr:2-oxoglutarate and iron-dependent oxygenase domain-containing protein [Pseudooceanicola sediminis]KAA2313913.1 isopenicillin N synthase family oxygenase [Puniceibacterium sp. HSS470]RII38727.1 isopenicillin N synthase family oxygenase [Pseudooceanicola sediminis]|tara:strand:+ start:37328 stop:38314 length:987 start_codon:yes stop_codon:yes gene_type:complete
MERNIRAASRDEVPVLDLTPLTTGGDITALAEALDAACRNTGFFYVKNHGVPEFTLNAVFGATRRYFALPQEVRDAHVMDPVFRRGFMPQGVTKHPGFKADLKESYEVGVDLPLDDPDVAAGLPLHGPNQWPEEFPWLREAAETYFNEMRALGERMLRLVALAVGMPEDHFLQFNTKPMVQMRLFHYAQQPEAAEEDGQHGAAPHTDYGLLTLLAQDPIGGLELQTRQGEWVKAPYIDGAFVVNIGDLFQRWTNDRYFSNKHRVVNLTGRERYSIPLFYNLDYHAPVECLPSCLAEGETPKHAPTTCGEYLTGRFKAVQGYKTKEELA